MPPLLIVNGGSTVGQVFRRGLTRLPLTETGAAAKAAARSEYEKNAIRRASDGISYLNY